MNVLSNRSKNIENEAKPLCSVIILNYNGESIIEECLLSVLNTKYPKLEIIVVDNGSTDSSCNIIKKYEPKVRLVKIPYNVGFAIGNNIGIKSSRGEYIVLLNNDTVVHPSWISNLIKIAESDQNIGILGCKVYYMGTKILQHAGGKIDVHSTSLPHIGIFEEDVGQYDEIKDVDYVSGVSMMIRRKVIEKIGLFDPDYFLYWEDVDYCFRAKKAGFRIIYVPSAIVEHFEGFSVSKLNKYRHFVRLLFERNRILFVLKNFSSRELALFILKDVIKQLHRAREGIARLLYRSSYYFSQRFKNDDNVISHYNWKVIQNKISFSARSIITSFIGLFYAYLFLIFKGPFIRKHRRN
ncbi:MAG: glycosyltransferase family 2 protein [Ignisphaera sp.]